MKTALITGANRSIGFETARQMIEQGYFVFVGSRDRQKGEEAATQLNAAVKAQDNAAATPRAEAIHLDVIDPASITTARETIGRKTGSLDVLINNAGISGGFPQPATSIPLRKMREVFETNLFAVVEMIETFFPLLKAAPEPRIVNVTSGLASLTLHSDPNWKYYAVKGAAYGPSKTALNAYTIVLAYELRATPFKVNVVDPGYTATDFNQHRGTGNVKDAAAIIVKYATIGADGPTGKFFSHDYDNGGESPW
jgi:NAD(P)-dependent dehydrogenase (short-subunit alcohol dehydrogenase family)